MPSHTSGYKALAPISGGWRGLFLRLGHLRAVAALTAFTTVASVLLNALLMEWLGMPFENAERSIAISVLIPLLLTPLVSHALVGMLFELEAVHHELHRLATRDPLTDAWNRRHFLDRIELEYARSRRVGSPLAVVMIDADRFKRVNDAHGHAGGDTVLKGIAATCTAMLRPYDEFARLGGEEFVLLLPDTAAATAAEVAERIRAAIAALQFDSSRGGPFSVTASLGIAELHPDDGHALAVLERADAALYAAKTAGRNRCERR